MGDTKIEILTYIAETLRLLARIVTNMKNRYRL
jgi:hypothetical protein